MQRFLLDLKISRPGLWFPTVWIYLVPFGGRQGFVESPLFWIGLFFVTFPLNYLVYGLNDYNDIEADAVNTRKGNYLFGARAAKEQLRSILQRITLVVLPFFVLFVLVGGLRMLVLLGLMVVVNLLYNFEPFRLKERPPFEIAIQSGYVLTAIFSTSLNDLPELPWQTLVYLALFASQAHIAGEIMDIEPDRLAGKKTTAVLLGRTNSKLLMLLLLLVESYLLFSWFDDLVLAGFLLLFSIWLLIDLTLIFRDRPYSDRQMRWFGYAINAAALLSMLWVLYSGSLLRPV